MSILKLFSSLLGQGLQQAAGMELPPVGAESPYQTPPYAPPATDIPAAPVPAAQTPRDLGIPTAFKPKSGFGRTLAGIGDALINLDPNGSKYESYSDREDKHWIGQAMGGLKDNPEQAMRAIAERNPALAEKIMEAQSAQAYREASLGVRRDRAESQNETDKIRQDFFIRSNLGGMIRAAKDPAAAKRAAVGYLSRLGRFEMIDEVLRLESPEDIEAYAMGTVPVHKQEQIELGQGRLTEAQRAAKAREAIASDRNAISSRGVSVREALLPSQIESNEADADFSRAGIEAGAGRGVKPVRRARPGQAPSSTNGAPPVGYKNKHGLIFKGGDPNDRRNWK